MDRPEITDQDINDAVCRVRKEIARRLNEKGPGSFASRHEILGIMTEEFSKLTHAVECESLDRVGQELIDLAVGGLLGLACIKAGKLDW